MYIYFFSRFLWPWHDNQTGKYNAIEIVTGCYTVIDKIEIVLITYEIFSFVYFSLTLIMSICMAMFSLIY